jgi:asparagine synthase (glutamine-hydrolysing)
MSGVFAIVDPAGRVPDVGGLARRMSALMSHRAWHVTEWSDVDPRTTLGRLGIGIFNSKAQPLWSPDRGIAVVMAGEAEPVAGDQPALAAWSDPAYILDAYARDGDSFARNLKGAFVVALWHAARRLLLIANDRFGLYPLYISRRPGTFVCAPEMKAVLADPSLTRHLDLTALAEYVRFQHLLGQRTFFQEVELLAPATIVRVDTVTAECSIETYWTPADLRYRPNVTFTEAVEEAGALLRRAVRRMSGDGLRPGVHLSGGLDSRTILGLVERRPVASLTFGHAECRDVWYARRIAQAVGSQHHWHPLRDGRWVRDHVDLHLDLTEGFHSWIHAHGISALSEARAMMDVNLTGWDGGTIMGHDDSIEPLQTRAVDGNALVTHLFELFTRRYTWPSVSEAEELCLYPEALGREMRGRAFDSFRQQMSRYLAYRGDIRGELFLMYNHCLRLTHPHLVTQRSHFEVRFPFFDYDLVDFLFSLPAELRGHQVLYRAIIQRELPHLARIPNERDELPPTTNPLRRAVPRVVRALRHRLNGGVYPLFRERPRLYADYEAYARHELRDWIEDILFDARTRERGLFDPAFVRTLVARHCSGLEKWTIGKIAPLVTYEMMLRRFND